MAVGFVAAGSPTAPIDSEKSTLGCGAFTVVSDATCTAPEVLLFLLVLLAGVVGTALPLLSVMGTVTIPWRHPPPLYPFINRPAFSALVEAFRRGLIHPTLYDLRV